MTKANTPAKNQVATILAALTPAQSEAYAQTSGQLSTQDYLPVTFHDGTAEAGKSEWSSHVAANLTPQEAGALAWVLIDTIMQVRFGPASALYEMWRTHTLAGTKIPPAHHETIGSFVEPVFGLPTAPKSKDHLHGHIGEWLWHLLTKDKAAVHIQPDPKGDVTDAGADGFSIYENNAGALRFRLWESKKNTGNGRLSSSLGKAYGQIEKSGQRYVAKIVGTFMPGSHDNATLAFIAEVPSAWAQGDGLVGAGVTLATHQPLPGKPFKKMSKKLPLFDKPGQLRGLATSISCYDELANTVRRYAWTAL